MFDSVKYGTLGHFWGECFNFRQVFFALVEIVVHFKMTNVL